jgi:integrase
MASISFFLQSKKNPAPIYLRLRDSKYDAKAKTNLFINPENWNDKKKLPKNLKDANGKFIQNKLAEIESNVLIAINSNQGSEIIDSNWLYSILDNNQNSKSDILFTEYFDIYIEQKLSADETPELINKSKTIKKHLLLFEKDRKKKIKLIDVNIDLGEEFSKYLTKNNYRQSYIFRIIKHLKTVCFHAKANGYETSKNFELIKSKDKKAFKIYLNLEEIDQIEKAIMPHDYLENARDWLIISCFLGQRVSDFMRCDKSKIREINGNQLIDLTQKKTKKEMMIGIAPPVKKILLKRNGEFPRPISDQRYNEYIKEVCKIAGINQVIKGTLYNSELKRDIDGDYEKWKLVSSHIGRRSFATNFYGKMSTPFLMAQTGHTTEKSFLEYIGKGRLDQIESFLSEFNKLQF